MSKPHKPRARTTTLEPLSPRKRGRGKGTSEAKYHAPPEPSSGAARHLLPKGEGKTPRSSFPRKRESSDVASLDNWESRDFTAALSEEKPPRHGKLQARDYKVTGKFPVIDQGQSNIAGWTDDEALVIDRGLPYVVFGDHTRAFKYVDFPFVLGADGTQLLKPSEEYCPRFFYYACLQLDLPSRGYNRHFTFLKETSLPLPPKPEQQKIAAVLWKLQCAIATQDKLLKATADLKASAMQRLFTHGLRGEPLKDTEIGPMPESWHPTRLDACCDVVSSSLSYTNLAELTDSSDGESVRVQGVKVSDMNLHGNERTFVIANLVRRLPRAVAEKKAIPPASTVFPKRGAAIATNKKRLTTTWTVLDPNLIGVRPKAGLDSLYLFFWFEVFDLKAITEPGPTPQLNKKNLVPLVLPVPQTESEQRAIASALATLDRKLAHHRAKRAALDDLFQTLLHQLMTGAIRVDALDIDVSEVADHFPDAGKMVGGHVARTSTDHLPGIRKMTPPGKQEQH